MPIYKSTKVLPYVYMCKEKESNRFYIGYRFANRVPSSDDFGISYFTSNKYVKQNFNKFDCVILAEFFDKKSALRFESQLISDTKSPDQINNDRIEKIIAAKYTKSESLNNVQNVCPLPGCGKVHSNWRRKCCCNTHQRQYAGMRAHKS